MSQYAAIASHRMFHRLPPEVLDRMVTFLTTSFLSNRDPRFRSWKRDVGACILTCRYWAQRCRWALFASLVLQSREDFHGLLSLIDSAIDLDDIPSLAECVQEIDIIHSGPWTVPWFHHIQKALSDRDIELDADRITLEFREAYVPGGKGAVAQYAPVSLSTSLPRTVPRSLFSHAVLHLTDLRFRAVRDLQRLIDGQPDLFVIVWKRLSFDAGIVVPPPRTRTRRSWLGMETITTSGWTDIDMELRIMFLIASEKVYESMDVSAHAWSAMPKVAAALLLPSNEQLELGLRGEAVGITFLLDKPTLSVRHMNATHLLEFHIAQPTQRTPIPHVSIVRVWLRASISVEELAGLDWDALEDAILGIEPVPFIEVCIENRSGVDGAKRIFKWLLDVVPKRAILGRAYARGLLDIRLALTDRWEEWRHCDYVTLPDVLAECSGEGQTPNASEAFDRMLCRNEKY